MSNVRPIFGYRDAPRLSDPIRIRCKCPANVIHQRENPLPVGWKRCGIWTGSKRADGYTCPVCVGIGERMEATGQSCFVEVIG